MQLYKNNAHALCSRILSILNLDWLLHARSVRGVYELMLNLKQEHFVGTIDSSFHLNGYFVINLEDKLRTLCNL